jgi:hypothetical protein
MKNQRKVLHTEKAARQMWGKPRKMDCYGGPQ